MSSDVANSVKDVLKYYVGTNRSISKHEITNNSVLGENYSSDIYKINFLVENVENGTEDRLHAIVKCLKPNCTEQMKMYSLSQFVKEINFYCDVLPCLNEFQTEENFEVFDGFPEMLGFRKNVNGRNDVVDENVVIVLENLSTKGK